MNKEQHEIFCNKLKPYPFYYNSSKKVYVKIVKMPKLNLQDSGEYTNRNDKNDILQISLINDDMLNYDASFFGREKNEITYRPYFYEFYSDSSLIRNKEALPFLAENQGVLLIGEFKDDYEQVNKNDYTISGTVFFSASPFRVERKYLTITNKAAPDDVKDKYLKTYNTSASVVTSGTSSYNNLCNILNGSMSGQDFYTRIYNVGQGNCVYIYSNKNTRILFDIGYNKIPGSPDWNDYNIKKSKLSISHMRPHLNILSHWDMDHIIGVVFAQDDMFNHPWIAPDLNELSTTSISATRLAKYLCWKNQLFLIDKGFLGTIVHSGTGFRLWRGAGRANTGRPNYGMNKENNYGLIIELFGDNNMLLPGDCEYAMLPAKLGFSTKKFNYLMVPHHCSRMQLIPLASGSSENDYAVISVGDNSYKPKHPYHPHKDELEKEYKIKQTVGNWYIEIPSLNGSTCCNEVTWIL